MSRIGKKPISFKNITVTKTDNIVKVKGPLGELEKEFNPEMNIKIEANEILVERPNDERRSRAIHGLTRALLQNMVTGVAEGFTKTLDIVGVGYKVEARDKGLILTLGFSHAIYFLAPEGISFQVPTPTQIVIKGIDKALVGQIAAKIRSLKKPEPYKGKGVKYSDEVVRRKAGKSAGK